MYPKNCANPPAIFAQLLDADDSPIESNVVVYHIANIRTLGAGTLTYFVDGIWSYTPTREETNYNSFAIQFYHPDAKELGKLISVVTSSIDLNPGYGSYLVIVTVLDENEVPIPSTHVRFRQGNQTYIQLTNGAGKANFALDAGSWICTITKVGYDSLIDEVVVSKDTELSYALSNLSLPVSNPGFVTAYSYVFDEFGNPKSDIPVACQLIKLPGYGIIQLKTKRVSTSNASGLVVFENLVKGAQYEFYVDTDNAKSHLISIPKSDGTLFQLPSFVSGYE